MRVLDLFSGIGGFSLGLERAGMRTVAFCEIEPYCRAVLAKHWPDIPCFPDIRGIDSYQLGRIGGIDVICGGFPCQDISVAGKGAGLAGERSGLWSEYARLIGLVRPQYVIVENVSALLGRGLDTVLGDLAALGYDAEWHCIPAAYVGAPHRRDRVWIVAYPFGGDLRNEQQRLPGGWPLGVRDQRQALAGHDGAQESLADCDGWRREGIGIAEHGEQQSTLRREPDGLGEAGWRARQDVADSEEFECGTGLCEGHESRTDKFRSKSGDCGGGVADAGRELLEGWRGESEARPTQWLVEPDVGRVAHGVPARVDRLKALGNAVVPQVVEIIGRAIMQQVTASPNEVSK